jgi:acetolactate synthase-1/2/3 large subunit
VIDKALGIALRGRPGLVQIDLPISVAETEVEARPLTIRPAPAASMPADGGPVRADRIGEATADHRRP